MALTSTALPSLGDGLAYWRDRPILIGFADALSAPECAWSLLEAGHSVGAFARRGSRPPLRRCKEITLVEVTSPEIDVSAARADLHRVLRSGGFGAVLPLDDESVWLCNAAAQDVSGFPVIGPIDETAELALDKRLQLAAARRAGFVVPATSYVESSDDLMSLSDLPTVLKPAQPIVHRGAALVSPQSYVCANSSELARAARAWQGEPLLAQPLISGIGEGLFGISGPKGLHALSAHRRIRMMNPQGSGSSACAAAPVDPKLASAAQKMLGNMQWQGLFMLEFLRDRDGTAWFMELNGRAWGSMALARRSGLEYPAWAARQLSDSLFEPPETPFAEQTCRHLGRELVHLLMVIRGPRSVALTEWPTRSGAMRDVLRFNRNDGWYNWRPGDRGVFFEETARTIVDQLRHALTR